MTQPAAASRSRSSPGPDAVATIGIVSGGAAKHLDDAIAAGLDAFVTGEPREPAMNDAREAGIHFLAAGHYATETFGVRAPRRPARRASSASGMSSPTSRTRFRQC